MTDTTGPIGGFSQPGTLASDFREARKIELGLIGKIFGGGDEKSGNFAAIAFALSLVALMVVFFAMPAGDATKAQAITTLASVVTGSFGFVLGKKTS